MPRIYKEQLYTQEEREQLAMAIIEKIKQKRRDDRKGTNLASRIRHINEHNAKVKNNMRKLAASNFKKGVL